ncbi:MAG: hypothetical protein LCH95_23945 [Proteobacteria bacterium]|nr:hypothetical protein [Pseudomonadota bacterium]
MLIAVVAVAVVGAAVAAVRLAVPAEPLDPALPTVAERIADLRTERAGLQARADAEARIALLPAFRTAGMLVDDLAARHDRDGDRAFDRLSPAARQPFQALDALNDALREALERQTEGARAAAQRAGEATVAAVDRLVAGDAPTVLAYTPSYVPPRRAGGDLSLAVPPLAVPSPRLALEAGAPAPAAPAIPAPAIAAPGAPRYAPPFAPPVDDEPAVTVEVVGANLLSSGGAAPVLSIGGWRGPASVRDGRLVFAVPRQAFPSEATRTAFTLATLTVRREARPITFQLLFAVLPDKPGWFALDQRVQAIAPEANTLVSPEILARAAVGESRTVRRCFDPPEGWRFDAERVRVVIVERLGWQDDLSDPTLNGGSVEIVPPDKPGQVCLSVMAKPAVKTARTATIGRFEATLVRDVVTETIVRSGVRALDWREAMRVPLDPRLSEWKLYVRMFDGIDREFSGRAGGAAAPLKAPFLSIEPEEGGKALVLRVDPAIE